MICNFIFEQTLLFTALESCFMLKRGGVGRVSPAAQASLHSTDRQPHTAAHAETLAKS